MKKIFFTLSILFWACVVVQAQTANDALRYAQLFYTGTARSAAMGNAMTALGGDFGSLAINPAGSALYPYSELTFTPFIHNAVTKADYLSVASDNNRATLDIANIGYIHSFNTSNYNGLTGFTFGIGYNALNNFTERLSATGVTDQSSWLAALAYRTNGIHATNMDLNDYSNPFYNTSIPWKAILAWNASLLDTLNGGIDYLGATETIQGNQILIPGKLHQNFFRQSKGYVGEYLLNFGFNFSHKLFVGANIGVQSVYYDYGESFSESVDNPRDFLYPDFSNFTHTYNQKTSGVGVNFKVGFIYIPFQNLRIGASVTTPTWMRLDEEWDETITANFQNGDHIYLDSPIGEYAYRINTPFRWSVGMAYTLGAFGALSVDYEQAAYDKLFISSNGANAQSSNPFSEENNYIKKEFTTSHIVRTGLELNLNEEFSLRGGYAHYGSPEKSYNSRTQIASLGVGLHLGSFSADLTFMQQFAKKEGFSLYDDVYDNGYVVYEAPVGTQSTSNWKLLLGIGFKF